jgi:hypothetical protein
MTAHVAFLRVYEPLAAFEGAERRRWETYLAEQEPLGASAGAALEHEAALQALVGALPRVVPDVPEHAYVAEVDGVTLLCPWRTRLRALEALEEFLADVPDELVPAWVPRPTADAVGDELDAYRVDHPEERVPQLSSTWHVPLRWFVLVDAGEREVHLGAGPSGVRTGRSLVYRTPMSRARRRVARALAVLRRTVEDGVVTAGVEDLGRWLEEFHPRSLVELDYGGLVHLLDDAELQQDESARDVALALAALGEGATDRAAAAYGRVTGRMKALQAVESAN